MYITYCNLNHIYENNLIQKDEMINLAFIH